MQLPFTSKQFSIFFLLSAFLFSACTKITSTDIGGGLIPPVDGVNTKEMYLDVVSDNAKDTITRVGTPDDHALGYVHDPLFGTITASINVQLKPTIFPFSFPVPNDSIIAADSVVLVLSYRGVWGDSTQTLSFKVFEIPSNIDSAVLSKDSVYTTDHPVESVGSTDLTENHNSKFVDPRTLNDSLYPFMEQATNQLRIRIDTSYARNKLFGFDTTVYGNDSLFGLVFKGYQIIPQQLTGNALLRINLLDTNTKLAIYFRYLDKDTVGKIDTAVRYFRCNVYTCGSSNYIQRNRTGTKAQQSLPPFDNKPNDSLIYIDGNPGIYARLEIPGLTTLSNKIIHRAEILMEQAPDPSNIYEHFFTPPNLFLTPYSEDSMRRFALPNDVQPGAYSVTNQASFGCFPFAKSDSVSAYSFDISRYVQGIITRHEKSYPLILYAPSVRDYIRVSESSIYPIFTGVITSGNVYIPLNSPSFGRVRLGGGGNSIHKMRLHIVYSDL